MSTPRAARPPDERGRLEIHPAVLRKIVEHAADQVPGTLRHGRRLAGIDVGEVGAVAKVVPGVSVPGPKDGAAGTDGKNAASGDTVDVAVELTLQYPAAVRRVVEDVRSHVDDELARIAGYRLRAFAVKVSGLRGATPAPVARLH